MSQMGHFRPKQRTLPPGHFRFAQKLTSGANEKLVANGMDRPCSRPRRHAECAEGLSGEGALPCFAQPPFTQ